MTTLNFKLLRWQQNVIADKRRFKVIVAGRRCGKTRFSVIDTIIKALECPNKEAGVLYVAPTLGMARTLCWDLLLEIARPVIAKVSINSSEVTLVNGVKIYVRGADNPDSLRGMKLYHATLDEAKDLKRDIWPLIVRPALADMKGTAVIIGTPEPGPSQFRDLYDQGQSDDPKLVDWASWHFTTVDNETIDPAEIEEARATLSTQQFNQEFMASFQSMEGSIFKEEWVKYADEIPQGDTYIAVDPAGFEEVLKEQDKKHLDNTAIAVVTVTDNGDWYVRKVEYGRWDVRETAVRVLMAIRTHKPLSVGIEKGSLQRALMPYLSDLMRKNAVYAHIEPIQIAGQGSKINRITYNLQGLMEHGRIYLNKREKWDRFLIELLAFPSKNAHDDLIDALSLVANLVRTSYARQNEQDEYEVLDEIVGF
jgi:predicted phage terminase large subunit-like protein